MNVFQQYFEWMPEKFREEKLKGKFNEIIDIPSWMIKSVESNHFMHIERHLKKNGILKKDDRIVALANGDYWYSKYDTHQGIITYLMEKNIIPRDKKTYEHWESLPTSSTGFLCLQVEASYELMLSESYDDSITDFLWMEKRIVTQFSTFLKKIERQGYLFIFEKIKS